jgi:spore maturation protein CgeB
MRFVVYTHSLVSDWNHGNAHFLRGVLRDLIARGHEVAVLEPAGGWSRTNLLEEQGPEAVSRFARDFPSLSSILYDRSHDPAATLDGADVVIVHEWTDPDLVARIGRARLHGGTFTLLFHDTHHRAVSAESDISGLDLSGYDAVLAFGETLRERYLAAGWGRRVFTWHEAADTALFRPMPEVEKEGDVVWVGNWGDDERTAELHRFLIEPVATLHLDALVHGVRYPKAALVTLADAGIKYGGWIANADVPAVFARHRFTVHIPRRPYVESLPGIPTIRVFEALACGIPLISAPWHDAEHLFRPGKDFLFARDGAEMTALMSAVLHEPGLAGQMAASGLETIRARHTCRHRVDELLAILAEHGTERVRTALATREPA